MPDTTLTAYRLRGIALTIVISTVFGAFWGVNGSVALAGSWRWMTAMIVGVITIVFFITAYAFRRRANHLPALATDSLPNPFRTRSYRLAVAAEIIAIPLASRLLSATGYDDAMMPVIAMIVGLHFFGLIPAFRAWQFAWVGGAFCVLALAALMLPARVTMTGVASSIALRNAIVGFGCALILWISTIPIIVTTRRQLAQRRS